MHSFLSDNFSGGFVNWRLATLHYVAKALGVLVKVEGFPYGSRRNLVTPKATSLSGNLPKPFLKAGHEFRDTDNTLVATLVRDVYNGEPLCVEMFKFEKGFEQNPGETPHSAIAFGIMRFGNKKDE